MHSFVWKNHLLQWNIYIESELKFRIHHVKISLYLHAFETDKTEHLMKKYQQWSVNKFSVMTIRYRIASNKRPTSKKCLPQINAHFFLILFYKRLLRINSPLFKGKERNK